MIHELGALPEFVVCPGFLAIARLRPGRPAPSLQGVFDLSGNVYEWEDSCQGSRQRGVLQSARRLRDWRARVRRGRRRLHDEPRPNQLRHPLLQRLTSRAAHSLSAHAAYLGEALHARGFERSTERLELDARARQAPRTRNLNREVYSHLDIGRVRGDAALPEQAQSRSTQPIGARVRRSCFELPICRIRPSHRTRAA